jgi:putative Holliday junction resolvase
MRNLGLDVGDKRIGLAVSDPDEILASPVTTINRDNDQSAIAAILKIIGEYKVEKIIIGIPYSLDGSVGNQAQSVIDFKEKLSQFTEVAIETQDERLSTIAADNLLMDAGVSGKDRKERRDAAAAAFILQGYLDSRRV